MQNPNDDDTDPKSPRPLDQWTKGSGTRESDEAWSFHEVRPGKPDRDSELRRHVSC